MLRRAPVLFAALAVSLLVWTYFVVVPDDGEWRAETVAEGPARAEGAPNPAAAPAAITNPNLPAPTATETSVMAEVEAEVEVKPAPASAAQNLPATLASSEPVAEAEPAMAALSNALSVQSAAASPIGPAQPAQVAAASVPPEREAQAWVLRKLPQSIDLRYRVKLSEVGFTLGHSRYSGHIRDGRYALNSVTEATGAAALLMSGKIVQRSEGRITAQGLQPELFVNEKGKRKPPPVHFDWSQKRVQLRAGWADLPAQTQDLTSFPFHLAMRAREGDKEWLMPVTNGKHLHHYRVRVVGRETLTLGGERLETLRLECSRSDAGQLDVWLALAQPWLPVQIRTQDEEGKVILMTLQKDAA